MVLVLWIVALVLPFAFGSDLRRAGDKAEILMQYGGNFETVSEQDVDKKGKIYAVLVAGSYEFYDYRHQADICHAYQIFRRHGVPDKNIIVMMYDDIASNPDNPNPGVIINKPGGPNVYSHVPKDYTGDNVTPENFLNVITGNKTALEGLGSGKVLKSGPNDYVFINFVDRGTTGEVAFPSGYLYASDLIHAFKTMYKNKMYKKLLVYLESSNSGSMFDGLLPSNLNILAVSASLPDEGSYATYWDEYLEVFLGDLFSVSWMEDIDSEEHHKNLTTETLITQYYNVRNRTYGYSTPTMYGTQSIAKDHVTNFFGKDKKKAGQNIGVEMSTRWSKEVVKSQDVHLHTLQKKIQKRENPEEKRVLQNKLDALLKGRTEIENLLTRIISRLSEVEFDSISEKREPLTPGLLPCYKTLVDAFNKECVNITRNTFTLRHLYKFVNICAIEDLLTDHVLEAFKVECTSPNTFVNIH